MSREDRTTVECARFRESVPEFLGDRLDDGRRAALQAHLDRCPACAAVLAEEAAFDREVRPRLPRVPSPPGLEDRIRAALREEAGAGSAGGRRTTRLTAVAAAALFAALLILAPPGAPEAVPGTVLLGGSIVDHDCDRHGLSPEMQRACRDATHRNALRLDDGSYVRFSERDHRRGGRWASSEVRGARVEIAGRYRPSTRTVEIAEVRGL